MPTEVSLEQLMNRPLSPVVLVRTTPAVEQSCMKNNLSFIDMLRPYETVNKELYTRTVKEYESYPLKNFQIRFKTMDELSLEYGKDGDNVVIQQNEVQRKLKLQERFLQSVVSEAYDPKKDDSRLSPILESEDRLAAQIKQDINFTPWFDKYRDEFLSGFYVSDHETWDHPVACLTVISSSDPDPVKMHKELYNAEKPPKLFNDRFVDPDVFRLYILVHDVQIGSDNQAKLHLKKMVDAYGPTSCRLLYINSNNGDTVLNDMWTPNLPSRILFNRRLENINGKTLGAFLSLQDVSYIASLVDELVTNGIIPHMERKIKNINMTIASKKRGISGAFSGWFRKKKEDLSSLSARYAYTSSEIQLRKMADYCVMLKDYETALSTYRIVANEFKNNKQDLKHYAGAMEFSAICTLFVNQALITGLTAQVKKEVEQSLEVATSNYILIGETKYAIRASLFSAVIHKSRGDYKKAAELFARTANLESSNYLLDGLLLEQTAFCHLLLQVPKNQIRKFALFLVLAGHKYFLLDREQRSYVQQNNIKQANDNLQFPIVHHAYRCYKTVLQVHYNRDWSVIFEHMSGMMADLSLKMSHSFTENTREYLTFMRDSIQYMHDFVGGCNISGKSSLIQGPEEQKQNMKKFLDIVANYMMQQPDETKSPLDSPLQIPEINTKNFRLLMNQYGNIPNYVCEYPRGEWHVMEENFVKSMHPFHIFSWERNNTTYKEPAVLFEPIYVEMSVKNVLYIPIRISKLHLIATFIPAKTSAESEKADEQKLPTEGYKVVPEDIVMKPGQIQTIRLSIIPIAEGELKIQGVSWSLENVIEGVKYFETKGRRLNENSMQRSTVMYELDNRLNLRAIGNMPLLEIELENAPSELHHGQIHYSTLKIKNIGGMGLKNLKLKISHPQFLVFAMHSGGKTIHSNAGNVKVSEANIQRFHNDLSVIDFSQYMSDRILSPSEQLSIRTIFRGAHCGSFYIKFLFYYEPEIPNSIMKFRLHKLQACLQVNDSLHLYHFSQPSSVQLHDEEEFILGITATNQCRHAVRKSLTSNTNGAGDANDSVIRLHQISAVSPEWTLIPLNFSPGSVPPNMVSLLPSESTTLYFKICKINRSERIHDSQEDNLIYHHNLLLYADNTDTTKEQQQVYDSSSGPHLDFLYRDCVRMAKAIELDSATSTLPNYGETLFPFEKKHGLSIITFWKFENNSNEALQLHILNTRFLPEKNNPIQMHIASNSPLSRGPNALCPINVSLHYNDTVAHKFSSSESEDRTEGNSMLSLPIVFQLSNISPDLMCDLSLELLPPDYSANNTSQSPEFNAASSETSAPFIWMGSTRLRFKKVMPSEQLRIPVQACFFCPGKYNLNQFRIYWSSEEVKAEESDQSEAMVLFPKKPVRMDFNTMQFLLSIEEK